MPIYYLTNSHWLIAMAFARLLAIKGRLSLKFEILLQSSEKYSRQPNEREQIHLSFLAQRSGWNNEDKYIMI